jgi:hypothetical protein
MKRARTWLPGAVMIAAAIMATPATAQQLAVPGRSPANPAAVISVPEASETWRKLLASPAGPPIQTLFTKSPWAASEPMAGLRDRLTQTGAQLGFSLLPADLLTNTVNGIDLYAIRNGDEVALVIALSLYDAATANRVLDQLKRESAGATGMSGGHTADRIEEKEQGAKRFLYLPGFSLYLGAESTTLVISSDREALESAMADQGRAIFTSEFYQRFMAGLEGEPADAWMFGEVDLLTPLLTRGALPVAGDNRRVTVGKLVFDNDYIRLTTFVPTDDMELDDQRYALAAPPPGEITSFRLLQPGGMLYYGTNHFDGIAVLDSVVRTVTSIPGSTVTREAVNEQLAGSRTLLGFDVQADLLANLGPGLGISINHMDPAAAKGMAEVGRLDAVVAVEFRDGERFRRVLSIFEEAASTPAGGVNARANAPQFIREFAHESGITYKYLDVPLLAEMGLVPSYAIVKDNTFVVATGRDLMERTLTIAKAADGAAGSLVQSPLMLDAAGQLEKVHSSRLILSMAPLLTALTANNTVRGRLRPEQPFNGSVIEMLKSMSTVHVTTIYKREGRKNEYLVRR